MKKLIALTRFNNHDPGDTFEASDDNAQVWIEEGLAEQATEKKKTADSPPADKAVKGGARK